MLFVYGRRGTIVWERSLTASFSGLPRRACRFVSRKSHPASTTSEEPHTKGPRHEDQREAERCQRLRKWTGCESKPAGVGEDGEGFGSEASWKRHWGTTRRSQEIKRFPISCSSTVPSSHIALNPITPPKPLSHRFPREGC